MTNLNMSTLGDFVVDVLAIGAEKEVVGPYARRIVAVVQNMETRRNLTKVQRP